MKKDKLESQFNKVFESGKLVQVHVSVWGMAAQLQREDLKIDETLPGIFQLGKKYLISAAVRNSFKQIESRARNYLKANSFKFPVADAHFVPQKRILAVLDELNKFKQEFEKKVVEFLDKYDQYKAETLKENEAYKSSLESCYPNIDDIKLKFGFNVSLFEIAFPKNMTKIDLQDIIAEREAKAEALERLTQQMEEQKTAVANKMNSFVGECVQSLRNTVAETSQRIADKIATKEVITKTNLTSLSEMLDTFHALNFFDDAAVEQELKKVKALVSSDTDFKENREAIEELNKTLGAVLDATKNISDVDKLTGDFFRNIEV